MLARCVWRRASLTPIRTEVTVILVFLSYILLLCHMVQCNLCDLQRRLAICFQTISIVPHMYGVILKR